jgi:NADH-quinone oxidoreductase subunit H
MSALDQIFITLKHWVLTFLPLSLQPIASILLSITAIIALFGSCFALTTILERKGLGRIQNRYGPNRVGPFGLLQPIADAIKMLTKEDIVPDAADKVLHYLAPIVLTVPIWLAFSVLPFGRNMSAINFDAGIVFFFAVGASSELAVFMAGWASRNKYSLIGAMRAVAQMISYEVPLVLSTVPVIMLAGSLNLNDIVAAQSGFSFGIGQWNVFTPWGIAGFLLFLVAATAESNRSPFDLPEGESEIIAGYLTEYSGFKYALFFLGEYLGLFAVTGLGVTLFLGGWNAPLQILGFVPSWMWFFAKFAALIGVFIWVRGTVPRLRFDQLLNFAWKFLVPLTLINLFVAAVWCLAVQIPIPARWVLCFGIFYAAYESLGRALNLGRTANRHYQYAE